MATNAIEHAALTSLEHAGLRELAKLVNQSVETIISEHEKKNATVPSLDSLNVGPFDAPGDRTAELTEAIKILDATCAQLRATGTIPANTLAGVSLIHIRH